MVDWFLLVGGHTKEEEHYNHRGNKIVKNFVQYGRGKWCYHRADGSGGTRLHFQGEDAAVASMFLIKFLDHVQTHNLQEHMDRLEQEH